jgi:hypothetical protein
VERKKEREGREEGRKDRILTSGPQAKSKQKSTLKVLTWQFI